MTTSTLSPLPQTPLISASLEVVGKPIGLPYLLISIALLLQSIDKDYAERNFSHFKRTTENNIGNKKKMPKTCDNRKEKKRKLTCAKTIPPTKIPKIVAKKKRNTVIIL